MPYMCVMNWVPARDSQRKFSCLSCDQLVDGIGPWCVLYSRRMTDRELEQLQALLETAMKEGASDDELDRAIARGAQRVRQRLDTERDLG